MHIEFFQILQGYSYITYNRQCISHDIKIIYPTDFKFNRAFFLFLLPFTSKKVSGLFIKIAKNKIITNIQKYCLNC